MHVEAYRPEQSGKRAAHGRIVVDDEDDGPILAAAPVSSTAPTGSRPNADPSLTTGRRGPRRVRPCRIQRSMCFDSRSGIAQDGARVATVNGFRTLPLPPSPPRRAADDGAPARPAGAPSFLVKVRGDAKPDAPAT